MQLSPNFALHEFVSSQVADAHDINNQPDSEEIENLRRLCVEILEPLREKLGPIQVTSGYRCIALNRAVGSKDTSDHIDGRAADIKVKGVSPLHLCEAIVALGLPFKQCIKEQSSGAVWTHVSIPREGEAPARQTLTIDAQGTRQGLH